jgi:hypothetical protein
MPWHIGQSRSCPVDRPYAVIKDGTTEVEGCHPSREAAAKQMSALYASEPMARQPLKASPLDDDSFRLLAIPFTGPIPSPQAPRGVDLDGEWFSPRTDIRPGWLKARAVDWHHGNDELLGREVIGKAVDPEMDEETGWWVTVWLDHGSRRLNLVRKLAERGAQLFGSSESVSGLVERDRKTGEILVWPYWRQTLSTSPQNTHSVIRPIKAVLEQTDFSQTNPAFWLDLAPRLADIAADLRSTSAAMPGKSAATSHELLDAIARIERATERAIRAAREATE